MNTVKYDYAYMFAYSERPNTPAAKKLKDDVSEEEKKRRLQEIIQLQSLHSLERNKLAIGQVHEVLIEGFSKRSEEYLQGRNSQNKVVVFPKGNYEKGQYVEVLITDCTAGTLLGKSIN
jgi:tRNA-2-methylthio-N6-dimethylallyladenosine synthase